MDSNAMVDSYDSSLGTYASQATNGIDPDQYAGESGNVGSNGNIDLLANTVVHGNATPGPAGTVTVGPSASVSGATSPMVVPAELPPIDVPVIPSSGDLVVPAGNTVVLGAGDYHFTSLAAGSDAILQINGPARVVFDALALNSTEQLLVDGTNGDVEIYVETDFLLDSNTLMAPISGIPSELQLFLNGDNIGGPLDQVVLNSNAEFYGRLYAPHAAIDLQSNFALYGSIVTRRLKLDSNSRVHFDTTLTAAMSGSVLIGFETVSWRELSFSVR